jgi:hypothetical protein
MIMRTARALHRGPARSEAEHLGGVVPQLPEKYNGNGAGAGQLQRDRATCAGTAASRLARRGYGKKITGLLADATEVPDTAEQASGIECFGPEEAAKRRKLLRRAGSTPARIVKLSPSGCGAVPGALRSPAR